jgi:glycosyltransferase involved in cell wall biosynthesis
MAVGVPVIVSDTRIDQYYFNDSLVRFFHSGDDEDLARNMLDLIQHPEKRRVLVENTSEFIAKNDWTAKKQEYLELVARLTKRCAT